MKKFFLLTITLILGITLFGCTKPKEVQETKNEPYKQKIIILDSVNAPLPKEAQNVEYMPSHLEPQ